MSTLLKDLFSKEAVQQVGKEIEKLIPEFDHKSFEESVLNNEWLGFELKQRTHHMADCLFKHLNTNYKQGIEYLIRISDHFISLSLPDVNVYVYMVFPTVIELYGKENFEASVKGMQEVTKLISCEFAIRQFYDSRAEEMLSIALEWTKNENEHVRRLASEGCRPALPWGTAIQAFKKDPQPLFPILENLKDDESLFVRKSVANNLNDISKTHPEEVIKIAKRWKGTSLESDWIIKHACRTLLKQGHPDVLPIFGYEYPQDLSVESFVSNDSVENGKELNFSFELINASKEKKKVRIEYALYFLRKNGQQNHKVFMISEKELDGEQMLGFEKKYSFKPISTRAYYPGEHKIVILVNGVEKITRNFMLLA